MSIFTVSFNNNDLSFLWMLYLFFFLYISGLILHFMKANDTRKPYLKYIFMDQPLTTSRKREKEVDIFRLEKQYSQYRYSQLRMLYHFIFAQSFSECDTQIKFISTIPYVMYIKIGQCNSDNKSQFYR